MKSVLFLALLCYVWGKDDASPLGPVLLDDEPNPEALNRFYTDKGEFLYQGDMVLSDDQYDALFGSIDTRKAINDLTKRWPRARVPYAISQSSENDRDVIVSGLQHWEANTCVRFNEVDEYAQEPHLIFEKNTGCHSKVGMKQDYGQEVSIGKGCEHMGTVVHEVGHALGFYHEQSRPDRDTKLTVLKHNINQSHAFNFNIQKNTDSHGIPYDVGSIMQYAANSFTKNGRNTMAPHDIFRTYDLGQHNGLSFYDVKLATIIYNCADHCTFKPSCQNDGFVDSNCNCRCPPGFDGSKCERRIQLSGPTCGGVFTSPNTISTPNYPDYYPKDSSCIWVFKAPAGKRVRVSFESFDLIRRGGPHKFCVWDHLEIRTSDMLEGEKYCDNELADSSFVSSGSEMAILFHSKYGYNQGFEADVTFE